jgi:hypothetical protein
MTLPFDPAEFPIRKLLAVDTFPPLVMRSAASSPVISPK